MNRIFCVAIDTSLSCSDRFTEKIEPDMFWNEIE